MFILALSAFCFVLILFYFKKKQDEISNLRLELEKFEGGLKLKESILIDREGRTKVDMLNLHKKRMEVEKEKKLVEKEKIENEYLKSEISSKFINPGRIAKRKALQYIQQNHFFNISDFMFNCIIDAFVEDSILDYVKQRDRMTKTFDRKIKYENITWKAE